MKKIFTEDNRLQKYLDVEAALARAHGKQGTIPKASAAEITQNATTDLVKIERVKELEAETKHDVMAVVRALVEQCGDEAGKYVHLGATSYDIVDTAVALQLQEAVELLREDLVELQKTLVDLAEKHKTTVMMGRTHGQFAVPITFGLKIAVYAMEVTRHLQRLDECIPRICVGKMSGAVGTGASYGKNALEFQNLVMEELGLTADDASTQIVTRDRHIEFLSLLANISTSLEKFATEIRNLQRSELMEAAEAFDVKKQVGSSTMAHKKNPITTENVSSLARLIRGFLTPMFENAIQWHERDLANSAGERFIIPHMCILTDDILVKMSSVFKNLAVYPENMERNLDLARGTIMAESVMIALVEKGIGRDDAYKIVRECSLEANENNVNFGEILENNETVTNALSSEELKEALDPKNYLGSSEQIVDNIVQRLK
jgi:adenylosuccinate lyase